MQEININENSKLVLNAQDSDIVLNINNSEVTLIDKSYGNIKINLFNSSLNYELLRFGKEKEVNISINESSLDTKIFDLFNEDSNNLVNLDLLSNGARASLSLASIAYNSNKHYKIITNNDVANTSVDLDCFGISQNNSSIIYDLTSRIKKGAKKSRVNQNSKILLFDKVSKGINNPILEIDENDVKANHGSSIGMIDEDTLFYLTSRGISSLEARKLVSRGRVDYLIDKLSDIDIKNELLKMLDERV